MAPVKALQAILATAMLASSAAGARAQTLPTTNREAAPFFVGGSMVFSSRYREIKDPPGRGYLHPLLHGSVEWPATGAIFNGGVFLGRSWSIGGELALRRAKTAAITEDEQAGHSATRTLSSTYTDRERLYSVVARHHFASHAVEVQSVVGVTASHSKQLLTDRRGLYQSVGFPAVSAQSPNASVSTMRPGLVGGADVMFPAGNGIAISLGTRLHWIKREDYDEYRRQVPHAGSIVLSFCGGLSWQPRLRAHK